MILRLLKNEKVSLYLIIFGFVVTLLGLLCFLWKDYSMNLSEQIKSEKFGQLGDFIGGIVGTFWALAGVILFYIALTEQRKDFKTNQDVLNLQVKALHHQITEFELQRKELENSRKVYEEANKTQRVQQFESNFYSLLNVYLQIKNVLNSIDNNNDYFGKIADNFKGKYAIGLNCYEHHDQMIKLYYNIYYANQTSLTHYFKCLYRIVKIIDSTSFIDKDKAFYVKILRSQLTDPEQLVLYYNSHTVYGFKVRSLILKYNLLKHIPIFSKPEFEHFYKLQKNYEIMHFANYLSDFLTKHINDSYDMEFNLQAVSENSEGFKCIIELVFLPDKFDLKIYCDKDLSINGITLTEDQFSTFIHFYLSEKVVLHSYLYPEKVKIKLYRVENEKNKVFGYTFQSDLKLDICCDKF